MTKDSRHFPLAFVFVSPMTVSQLTKPFTPPKIVTSVLGKDWSTHLKPGVKNSIPLPGTEYEAALVTENPFNLPALIAAEQKYGFKYCSILCGFMHHGLLWT